MLCTATINNFSHTLRKQFQNKTIKSTEATVKDRFITRFAFFGTGKMFHTNTKTWSIKLNSMALDRERTKPTERPPPVGEVSANFCG
jgi:hypothetical protein